MPGGRPAAVAIKLLPPVLSGIERSGLSRGRSARRSRSVSEILGLNGAGSRKAGNVAVRGSAIGCERLPTREPVAQRSTPCFVHPRTNVCAMMKNKKGRRHTAGDPRFRGREGIQFCLRRGDAELFLFLLRDDDPWSDHHHEALRLATDAGVLEEPVDVRDLREHRHAELIAALA